MIDLPIKINIYCSVCGKDLEADAIWNKQFQKWEIAIDNCEECMETLRGEAYQHGFNVAKNL
jgi:ribosomal protein L37AE/L43A